MTTDGLRTSSQRGALPGALSFLSGVVAAIGVAMIGFTSSPNFNPPGWLRILTMAPLPLALIAALGFGLAGLKRSPARAWAIAGLILAGLSVVAFGAIIFSATG